MAVMASGTSCNKRVMHLVCGIFYMAAWGNFVIFLRHVVSTNNNIADALSRGQVSRFHRLAPDAAHRLTPMMQLTSWWQDCGPMRHA